MIDGVLDKPFFTRI